MSMSSPLIPAVVLPAAQHDPDFPPERVRVTGVDLGMGATGVAQIHGPLAVTAVIHPPGPDRESAHHHGLHYRAEVLADEVLDACRGSHLILIESPITTRRSADSAQIKVHGVWAIVTYRLYQAGLDWVDVAPAQLQAYATGKGRAGKTLVAVAAGRRYPDVDIVSEDACDALVLAAMGADWLGSPLAPVPARHREVLDRLRWPARVAL